MTLYGQNEIIELSNREGVGTMSMIKFHDNGQAYIDFNSLELITSKEFVEAIKKDLEEDDYKGKSRYLVSSVDVNDIFVNVVLVHNQAAHAILHKYSRNYFWVEKIIVTQDDLVQCLSAIDKRNKEYEGEIIGKN